MQSLNAHCCSTDKKVNCVVIYEPNIFGGIWQKVKLFKAAAKITSPRICSEGCPALLSVKQAK